jgi:hypothetical protein
MRSFIICTHPQISLVKVNEVGRASGRHERGEKVYRVLAGMPEGKRPLGRPRLRWEDGIRMDLRETGLGGVDLIRLA